MRRRCLWRAGGTRTSGAPLPDRACCLPAARPPARPPRFNLLREESEGWAKLATLLNQQAAGVLTPATAPAVVRL